MNQESLGDSRSIKCSDAYIPREREKKRERERERDRQTDRPTDRQHQQTNRQQRKVDNHNGKELKIENDK